MKIIKDIKEFKKEASKESGLDCFISLAGGIVRSSKQIYFEKGKYTIYNDIDSTDDRLTEAEIFNEDITNIGKALTMGALIKY